MGKKATAYKNRYAVEHYDRINLVVKQGVREIIRKTAETKGESVNGYINKAIREALKRDGVTIEEDAENADIDETE